MALQKSNQKIQKPIVVRADCSVADSQDELSKNLPLMNSTRNKSDHGFRGNKDTHSLCNYPNADKPSLQKAQKNNLIVGSVDELIEHR